MPSVSDLRKQFFTDNTGKTDGSASDIERHYYTTNSGLTPPEKYSLADHKRAFLEAKTGLSGHTLRFLEKRYFEQQGGAVGPYSDMAVAFYDFDPFKLTGLELALDADRINGNGQPLVRDTFNRTGILQDSVSDSGYTWLNGANGVWLSTLNGKAYANTDPVVATMVHIDSGIKDNIVEGTVFVSSESVGNAGITTNYTDSNTYIFFDVFDTGVVRLAHFNSSALVVYRSTAPGFVLPNTKVKLKLETKGTRLKAYVDDVLFHETDTPIPSTNKVGLRVYDTVSSYYTKFEVYPVAYSEGEALAQWIDLSGKGRHVTQSDPAKQPKYRTANKNLLNYATAMCINAGGGDAGSTVTVDTTSQTVGTSSHKIVATATPAQQSGLNLNMTDNVLTPEKTYSFSCMIKRTVGTTTIQFQVIFRNAVGASLGGTTANINPTGSSLQVCKIENVIIPANTAYVSFKVLYMLETPTAGDTFYVGGFMQNEGATVLPFVPPVKLPNSKPTVQFDGLDDTLFSPDFAISQPYTVYAIVNADELTSRPTGYTTPLGAKPGGLHAVLFTRNNSATFPTSIWEWNSSATTTPYTGAIDISKQAVISIVANNTNGSVAQNGVNSVGNTGTNGITHGVRLSGDDTDTSTNLHRGSITAILIFSAAHDSATRKRVEKWLGSKYGIAVA